MAKQTDVKQLVKLKWVAKDFEENLRFLKHESAEYQKKVLLAGASAYATSMSKHSPPWMHREIPPEAYADGMLYTETDKLVPASGIRPILDLLKLVRSSGYVKFRSLYGRKLKEGYFYLVKIMRNRKVTLKWCRTLEEAQKYAHITYRGLLRASWGIGMPSASMKMPPAFRKLVSKRPSIASMSSLNAVVMNMDDLSVLNTNMAADESDSYFKTSDINASIAAVSTMDDLMNKFFKRKFEL